jgi:hypothetical protein
MGVDSADTERVDTDSLGAALGPRLDVDGNTEFGPSERNCGNMFSEEVRFRLLVHRMRRTVWVGTRKVDVWRYLSMLDGKNRLDQTGYSRSTL